MVLRGIIASLLAVIVMSLPVIAAEKDKPAPSIAHIRLKGDLDEAPTGESLFGGGGENLRMKIERIQKAKKDANVQALLIEIEGLEFGLFSFGKIEEVRRAIADFKTSGKKTYCYMEDVGGLDYLVACACDTICIPESGTFGLLGLRIEMEFYKDSLELVKVKADFLTMGEAKGAAEPYTRTSMSPENRKQYTLVLDDLYDNSVIKTIASSRTAKKLTPDQVKKIIDEAPYNAKKAVELGLVDKLIYADALEGLIKADLKADAVTMVKNYGKPKKQDEDNPLALLAKLMSPPKKNTSKKPKIALIYAVGGIESGKGGGGMFGGNAVGSATMIEAIQQAEKDETVKAIVLRVDSPGGSALASDLIWHELKRSKKPVIASMGDVAASGGYYIAMGASKVYAEPGTLTGSIGVISGKIVLGGLFEWGGVKTETLVRGKNSGIFSSSTPFSKGERDSLGAVMQEVYDQFLDRTLENRNAAGVKLTKEKLLPLAGGRIWTGRQAKEHGLVDALGTLDDALAEAKQKANLGKDVEPELLILPEPISFLDKLMDGGAGVKVEVSVLDALKQIPEARGHLRSLNTLLNLRKEKVWLMLPERIIVK